LDAFSYLEHVEILAHSESEPPPHPPQTELYHAAGAPLIDYIAEPWERNAQGCLKTNLQINPYYPCVTRVEYNYNQCGIKKKGMKTYYDNMQKEENTALHFPSFKNGDGVQKLVANMPDALALMEWELHTLENMRWNDNHQCPIIYWSRDMIKTMRCLMRQLAYAEHLLCAPQHCYNNNTPPKRLSTEMPTVDWWWETQVRGDTRG
jgi:hypothetical protein